MAMRYGYFDSEITGVDSEGMPIFDRAETSELFRLLFSKLLTNGVLAKPADCFKVLAGDTGLSVTVRPGFGLINGAFAYDPAPATFQLAAAPTSYSRIDRVVLRCRPYLRTLMCRCPWKFGTRSLVTSLRRWPLRQTTSLLSWMTERPLPWANFGWELPAASSHRCHSTKTPMCEKVQQFFLTVFLTVCRP